MKPWVARAHRWLGLVIGLQILLWLASGLTMSLLDPEAVEGGATRAPAPIARPWPQAAASPAHVLASVQGPVDAIESTWLLDRPVWRVVRGDMVSLRDADNAAAIQIDADTVRVIAQRDYTGHAAPGVPEHLQSAPLEARGHAGAVWRVVFADEANTTLYVSAMDGQVLERRTDAFRLFDIAWMLHIMDYTGRSNFNHPLVIATAGGGVLLAASGLWLLGLGLVGGAFRPHTWRGAAALRLLQGDDPIAVTIPARDGETVLAALARAGVHLPAQCGGGQTCGQCGVTVSTPGSPPTAGDRARLSPERLARGVRLACALPVRVGLEVQVPAADALALHAARIERTTSISPTLREIVVRPQMPMAPLAAGQFIEIEVPPSDVPASALSDPRAALPQRMMDPAGRVVHACTVLRAYSPGLPSSLSDGTLPLLVRLEHDVAAGWIGRGSGYLFAQRAGDDVRFRGPFGHFRLKPGDREKVFIGGGAGVAPLRAMLRERLASGGRERIHFWIGARTPEEVPYARELAALATAHPNVDVQVVYSASDGKGSAPRWIHDAVYDGLLRSHGALADCEFYVCGPPLMLEATQSLLTRIGIEPARVAYEDFGC